MTAPGARPAPIVYVDDEPHRAPGPELTGAQILALAGADPDDTALFAAGRHGMRIREQDVVPVQDGSRFVTAPR